MEPLAVDSSDLDWVLGKLSAARKPTVTPQLTPEQKRQELRAKQPGEVELWKTYKDSGWHPQHLDPLLKSFTGLINSRINIYKNRVEMPTSAIEHEHKKWFVKALKTYDPKKGAQLNTYITTNLLKAGRYIESNKNFAYISENVSKNIGAFNAFKAEVSDRLGHEPDDRTLHDIAVKEKHPKLGVLSLKDIKRLGKEQRRGLIETGYEDDLLHPDEIDPREVEVAHYIIPKLTPQERLVHEHTLGLNGKAKLKPGAIAKKLNMDNSKVAKLRSSIWGKMKPYLGG